MLKKVIKVFLVIVASLAVFIYGGVFIGHKVIFTEETSNVPTIEAVANDRFILGVQAHMEHPATLDTFIPVLAEQLRRHNEIAPELWPNNPLVNQSLIVEGLRSKKFWLISPDGSVTPLKKDDALSYGFTRNAYVDGFSFFDSGMYYAFSDEDLTNYLKWQKYLHEGTANYYEYVTGLYMGYPDQIKNSMDLDSALALLASREDIYVGYGLVRECYTVSGFACVLLDRLESDWKERLMDDPYATPIEMLYQHFINEPLPEPKQLTQSEIDAVAEEIQKLNVSRVLPRLFRLFYDILF